MSEQETDRDLLSTDYLQEYGYFERRLIPEPEPSAKHYTILSADDHLLEASCSFVDRVPKKFSLHQLEVLGPLLCRLPRDQNGDQHPPRVVVSRDQAVE
jgi:hypothetical protein